MKLIDFINMVIKENFRPRKIKFDGNIYKLKNNNYNYCGFEYFSKSFCMYELLKDLDLDNIIYLANQEVEIVEE